MPISKHEELRLNQFEFEARGELDQNGEKRPESTAMIGRNKRCILYVCRI